MAPATSESIPAHDPLDDQPILQIGDFPPTSEQAAVIRAGVYTKDNLLINAYAGAAKTSTMVMLANQPQMKKITTLALAFNKKIAEEMAQRLPDNCVSMTLNGLGHRTWASHIGKRCRPNARRSFYILKDILAKASPEMRDSAYEHTNTILKTVGLAKANGMVPDSFLADKQSSMVSGVPNARRTLIDQEEFFSALPEVLDPWVIELILSVLEQGIISAFSGDIDFDDQLYMPTLWGASFPNYRLTIVDEAQDLSPINHLMVKKIAGHHGRVIAVGDTFQAIYGFRGADSDSMTNMKTLFSMKEKRLSVSFRCPKAVTKLARWLAPDMAYPDWAEEGIVTTLADWTVEDLESNAVILCRNNAPLYNLAIKCIAEGRFAELVGNDLAKSLIARFKKLGPLTMPFDHVIEALGMAEITQISKTREHGQRNVRDLYQTLRILAGGGTTLSEIISYTEHITTMTGSIKLMTCHKSKGLEFENVYILDKELFALKKYPQDKNLLYVAQTRAQSKLAYIKSEDLYLTNSFGEDSD